MDSDFSFLSNAQAQLLDDILTRRNPTLVTRVQQSHSISRSDAGEIVSTLADEFTDSLDEEWEPTEYGRTVNRILTQVNAARIAEWPE